MGPRLRELVTRGQKERECGMALKPNSKLFSWTSLVVCSTIDVELAMGDAPKARTSPMLSAPKFILLTWRSSSN